MTQGAAKRRLAAGAACFVAVVVLGAGLGLAPSAAAQGSAPFSTANVEVTDDDGGLALFQAGNLAPGEAVSNCVVVRFSGSEPAPVRLWAASFSDSGLGRYLNLRIEQGSGGGYGECTGFDGTRIYTGTLAAFGSTHDDYAAGLNLSSSAASWTRTFRFTVELQNDPAAQGETAGTGFAWGTRTSAIPASGAPSGSTTSDDAPSAAPGREAPAASRTTTGQPTTGAEAVEASGEATDVPADPDHLLRSAQDGEPSGLLDLLARIAREVVEKAAFPFFLLLIVILFLVVQDRIDRRDPKLAQAPVHADPDLEFGSPEPDMELRVLTRDDLEGAVR